MFKQICQGCLALLCVSVCLWAILTHIHREMNGIPTPSGKCPYANKSPLKMTLSTYWISEYSLSIERSNDGKQLWTPKTPMFFRNRKWKETICLDDTQNDCYIFTIRDAGGNGLTDGSCDLWWDEKPNKRIRGSFGNSESYRFGRGCRKEDEL